MSNHIIMLSIKLKWPREACCIPNSTLQPEIKGLGQRLINRSLTYFSYDPKFTVKEFMLHPKSLGVPDFLQQQLMK